MGRARNDDDEDSVPEWAGQEDQRSSRVEDRALLRSVACNLSADDADLLRLRLVEELPQSRIAAELGCSQMHVSRELRRILDDLLAASS